MSHVTHYTRIARNLTNTLSNQLVPALVIVVAATITVAKDIAKDCATFDQQMRQTYAVPPEITQGAQETKCPS